MDDVTIDGGPEGPLLRLSSWRPHPHVVGVRLAGELDDSTVRAATAYLRDATADGPAHLVVDVSGVTFFGSAGVRLLAAAREGADGVRGALSLVGVRDNAHVARVLQVVGMDGWFRTVESVRELLSDLG